MCSPAQVGGFVLTRGGASLAFLRWVPSRDKAYDNRWDADTETLLYAIPERSRPFVLRPIENALGDRRLVNVMLLVGNRRYDVGSFQVNALHASHVELRRRQKAAAAASSCSSSPGGGGGDDQDHHHPPPPPPSATHDHAASEVGAAAVSNIRLGATAGEQPPAVAMQCPPPDSRLEEQYRALFTQWGLRTCYAQTMYRPSPCMHAYPAPPHASETHGNADA